MAKPLHIIIIDIVFHNDHQRNQIYNIFTGFPRFLEQLCEVLTRDMLQTLIRCALRTMFI